MMTKGRVSRRTWRNLIVLTVVSVNLALGLQSPAAASHISCGATVYSPVQEEIVGPVLFKVWNGGGLECSEPSFLEVTVCGQRYHGWLTGWDDGKCRTLASPFLSSLYAENEIDCVSGRYRTRVLAVATVLGHTPPNNTLQFDLYSPGVEMSCSPDDAEDYVRQI